MGHPDGYAGQVMLAHDLANDYQRMLSTLGNGGVFQVTRQGDGSIRFSRLK